VVVLVVVVVFSIHPSVICPVHPSSSSRKKKMMEREEDDGSWQWQQISGRGEFGLATTTLASTDWWKRRVWISNNNTSTGRLVEEESLD